MSYFYFELRYGKQKIRSQEGKNISIKVSKKDESRTIRQAEGQRIVVDQEKDGIWMKSNKKQNKLNGIKRKY